jgi:hypothetical protein
MNDHELSDLLRQAREQSPKPSPQLAARTMSAYREHFPRPSFLVRHWRMAAIAAAVLIAIGIVGTRSSIGSPLPPEYDRAGVVASGHVDRNGWTLEYSTVFRPVNPRHPAIFTTTDVPEPKGPTIVYHRYFGDNAARLYYGYDVVLQTDGTSGKVRIQPLSERPEKMPDQLRAAGSRLLEIRELPSNTFDCGQNIAVTLVSDPATGQQVIDYLHVDSSLLDGIGHILHNMIRAFHSHFEHH